MKRSELKRTTPLKPGNKPLKSRKPMSRGSVQLRARKPKAAKPKRAARELEDKHLADLCRGRPCYLRIPGLCLGGPSSPSHSNQSRDGKGMGLKARHERTVPGCDACHRCIDQGHQFSREEKFAIWDAAYTRWAPDREKLLIEKADQKIQSL